MVTPLAVANGANFALGLFLLTLAGIVLRRSPDRTARGPLGAFLVLVGLNYSLDAVAFGVASIGADDLPIRYVALGVAFLDPPLLLMFALSVAYGTLSRLRRALIALPALAVVLVYVLHPPPVPYMSQWTLRPLYLGEMASYYLLAFAFIVDGYLSESRTLQRERLATLVVAMGLVCVPRVSLLVVDFGFTGSPATYLPPGVILGMVGSLAAMLGVVWLVLHARARGGPHHDHVRRTATALAGLCGVVAVQWSLLLVPGLANAAYALLFSFRWLLFAAVFAAGLQRHDLLDLSDASRHRVRNAFAAALLVVAVAQLATLLLSVPGATLPTALAGSLGIVGVVGLGYAALRQAAPAPPTDLERRRQTLYRAHVELDAPREELEELRARLHLSERDARQIEEMVALERAAPAPAADLEEGRSFLGRYDVEHFLGAGGFGRAFLAWDAHAGERVVLKELLEGWRESPQALDRFRREAETAMRVNHPNLVGFRGLERTSRGQVLVLEFVEGERLRDRLARGPLAPDEAARVAADLLDGLAALHAVGIVHRDVKPDNVILRPDGRAVLLDFGAVSDGTRGTVLAAGGNPGTRAYMPPEQAAGRRVDARADVYALAATLWECLAGQPQPHGAPPPRWEPLLRRALAADPARRPADAAAFREALPAATAPR